MESNIKGLIVAGHEMASELKAECGAVDMRSVAKLISDLATQLEVQLVRANALAEDQQKAIESIKQADAAVKLAHEKFSALAAENAGLKSGAMDEIKVINRGGQAYCVKDGVQVNPMYARGWNDYRAKFLQSDTPATDAFLAEVRAQGVEIELEGKDSKIANLTAERDALREGEMGDARHSNTRAAADIYFQLVEECEIPAGGSLVEYVDDMREKLEAAENNLIDSECHVAELEEALRDKQALLEASEKRIAELEAREIKPAKGEVLVVVSGFTGCGKSAIAGEIEIAMKAIGVPVQWTNGDAEKRMTGADWLTAIEMYKPTVRIVEVNVPRAPGIRTKGE